MRKESYNVGELKRVIKESVDEFKPKLGANVMSDNKRNNDKSYKEAEKNAKDYDGGLKEPQKGKLYDKQDGNASLLDYNPTLPISDDAKKNIKAQMKGYDSAMQEKNGIPRVGEIDKDGKLLKHFSDSSKKRDEVKSALANSGLQGSKIPQDKKNNLYENTKPQAKRLKFKNTIFLNESQMLSRIPEEYKKDGQVIYMVDKSNNEYIVECAKSEGSGLIETNIVNFNNQIKLDEQVNRIHELFSYDSKNTTKSMNYEERLNENKEFEEIMNRSREIIK